MGICFSCVSRKTEDRSQRPDRAGVLRARRGHPDLRLHASRQLRGRALRHLPPAWLLAVATLSVSKILNNMQIAHHVMHGQYDWMG